MPGFFAGDAQAAVRGVTGTAYDFNGDWHALFDSASIADGEFNGRFLAWTNQRFTLSLDNFSEAWNYTVDYAETNGWPATVSSEASLVSWNPYTGTNDVAGVDLVASEQRSGWGCSISNTKTLIVQTEGPDPVDLVTRVVTRSGTDLSISSATSLAQTATALIGYVTVIKMTDTRYLAACRDASNLNASTFYLLDADGQELDSATGAAMQFYPGGLTRHSDTIAAFAYTDDDTGDDVHIVAIDVSSDTITLGTKKLVRAAAAQADCAALTATVGHVCCQNQVFTYTISWPTITISSAGKIDSSKTVASFSAGHSIRRLDDSTSIVIYNDNSVAAPHPIKAAIMSGTGTPSASNLTTVATDSRGTSAFNPLNLQDVSEDASEFVNIFRDVDNGAGDCQIKGCVIYVDHADSYAITASSEYDLTSGIDAEHVVGIAFGTSGYAMAICQDENDTRAMHCPLMVSDNV